MNVREKKHRLPEDFYKGEKTVSFTICIKNRKEILNHDEIFYKLEKILLCELNNFQCQSIIHLFMPDHLHLITRGINENSDVIKAVDMFKQRTGYWFYENINYIKWQKDYHDHIIRDYEDLKNHVYYILNNPVRKEICEHWKDYKYKGSEVYDFDEWD